VKRPTQQELIAEAKELVARSREHLEELSRSHRDTRAAISHFRARREEAEISGPDPFPRVTSTGQLTHFEQAAQPDAKRDGEAPLHVTWGISIREHERA
jgi:hypothetical protein